MFKPLKVTKKLSQAELTSDGKFPAYSSKTSDGGLIGFSKEAEFICDKQNPVYVIFGDHTRAFNIVRKSFSVLDNVKVLLPPTHNERALLFLFAVWQKQIPNLGYARHWKIAKQCKLSLPVRNNKIDFNFMASFIAKLEAERIAKLKAYLQTSGLDNYELSREEQQALGEFDSLEWHDFNIQNLFYVKNTGTILSSQIKENSGNIPYLCASAENNGVSSYISYNENLLEKGDCIFIGGKTFTVSYQKSDFFSNDSHNLALYLDNNRTKESQLYIATCLNKSLKHKYSWGDSVSKEKIIKDKITLPKKGKGPNYQIMSAFITAITKLVMRDIVDFADKKIATAKEIINITHEK